MKKNNKVGSFLELLKELKKGQEVTIRSIKDLEEEVHQQQITKTVLVTTAVPLTQEEKERLMEGLCEKYDVELKIKTQVSPNVLGGMKIQVGSEVIDTTIGNQLEVIKNTLLEK